jgi:hypothetical protein
LQHKSFRLLKSVLPGTDLLNILSNDGRIPAVPR